MKCDFVPADEEPDSSGRRSWKCSRCGQPSGFTLDGPDRIFATCRVIGWGDYLTYYLALFGLTKQRVQWLTGKPCGCGERATRLNDFGSTVSAHAGFVWRLCKSAFN